MLGAIAGDIIGSRFEGRTAPPQDFALFDPGTSRCIAGAVAEAVHGLPRGIADTARGYLTDDFRAVLDRFEAALSVSRPLRALG